eukprot:3229453-Lingulodinium_polyedra.AAC.1
MFPNVPRECPGHGSGAQVRRLAGGGCQRCVAQAQTMGSTARSRKAVSTFGVDGVFWNLHVRAPSPRPRLRSRPAPNRGFARAEQ